jgi:hypothetical protein
VRKASSILEHYMFQRAYRENALRLQLCHLHNRLKDADATGKHVPHEYGLLRFTRLHRYVSRHPARYLENVEVANFSI